jgi:hypothetical protein
VTREEAARIVAAMSANWPTVNVGPETYDAWWNSALQHRSFEEGLAAVERIVRDDTHFPTVARFHEIRRALDPSSGRPAIEAPARPLADTNRLGKAAVAHLRSMLAIAKGAPSPNDHIGTPSPKDCPACAAAGLAVETDDPRYCFACTNTGWRYSDEADAVLPCRCQRGRVLDDGYERAVRKAGGAVYADAGNAAERF